MKEILNLAFFIFFVAVLSAQQKGATPIQSEKQNGERGKTYAVVVGISDYQDPGIPDLRFADKDAEAFANCCRLKFIVAFSFSKALKMPKKYLSHLIKTVQYE